MTAIAINVGDVAAWLGLALLLAASIPILRGRAKDATITTLQQSSEARLERIKDLMAERDGASERADREHEQRRTCETTIAGLEAKIETLELYTAPEAFVRMTNALERLEGVMATAIGEQGELILKNTELASRVIAQVENLADTLENLAERLGSGQDRPLDPRPRRTG